MLDQQLRYRKLPPEEWGRLKPLFEFLDWYLPDSIAATAAVVENSRKLIVGFHINQLVAHSEPHWQDPEYRGRIDFLRLHRLIEPVDVSKALCAPGLMLVASNPTVERMAELAGYTKLPGTVWTKDLRKKEEAA
jgi:hypothetical protein